MSGTANTQVDPENPWPGLESFQESGHEFFFGRDREAASLLEHVLNAPATVLYGLSGLGKTSLLQAGLFPLLREQRLLPEQRFLPVYVRLEIKPGAGPLFGQLHQSVHESIREQLPDAMLPSDEQSLWAYLHRKNFELSGTQNERLTPVIVLDQFEEIFTLGERVPDLVQEFRNDLGDLAENRIPADLAARIEADQTAAAHFDVRSRNYKLLISLREDFLPDLEEWCRLIPALGRSRVRLLRLKRDAAFDAVHEPAKDLMTAALAKRVVDIVAGENLYRDGDTAEADLDRRSHGHGASHVEPALLSLFCRGLNEKRKQLGQERFEEALVEGAKSGILSDHYRLCVGDLPHVAEFIEEKLISNTGFRYNYALEDAVPSYLSKDELDQLIDLRLLRIVDYHGAQRIELTHDVLTRAVREHRDRRHAEQEKQAAEQEKQALAEAAAEREAELDRERQMGRRFRRLSAVLALVCVVAIVSAVLAIFSWLSAEVARNEADARLRETMVAKLNGAALSMLGGWASNGSYDADIMQMVLAAQDIQSPHPPKSYQLLTVLNQERDLLKVIDTSAVVASVAFSPDDTRIASGGKTVRLWDAASGQQIKELRGHESPVISVAFSPDGTRLASSGYDKTIRLWDAANGEPVGEPLRGHEGPVNSVAFSPDGTRLASGGADKTIRLWDAANGQPIREPLRGHDDQVNSVAFSPDGTRLASGGADKTIRLWDAATGHSIGEPLRGHEGRVPSVAFSPDGTRLASGGDKTVRLWHAANGQPIRLPLEHDSWVTSVAFSPDGTRLASSGYDKTVWLWDAATGDAVGTLPGHESTVTSMAFSGDSARLVSGSRDGTVRVWDARSWQPMRGHDDVAWAAFFDDGRRIGSGSLDKDKTVWWWDTATGRPIGEPLHVGDADVEGLFPVDEDRLLSFGSVDTVRLWDAHTRTPIGEPLRLGDDPDRLIESDKAVSRIAATLQPDVIQVYNVETMRLLGPPIRVEQPVSRIMFSRDGRMVATGGSYGTVRLWDSSTGAPIGHPMEGSGPVVSIAFSRDGQLLAVGYADYSLRMWDTGTYRQVGASEDDIENDSATMRPDSVAYTATFSPDSQILATGSDDGTIRLWDTEDQTELSAALKGHEAAVTSLDFSPDGKKLLSASEDGTLRLLPVPPRSPVAARDALCAKLTHNMSRKQWTDGFPPQIDYSTACPGLPEADDLG